MFSRKLCVFALLVCVSLVAARTVDKKRSVSNNPASEGHILYSDEEGKKGTCEKDADCQNGGKCTLDKEEKKCECIIGTHGDHCEIVDGCVETPSKCGNDSGVKCVFNTQSWGAECQCVDANKAFDDEVKMCRTTCKHDKDCDDTWCRRKEQYDDFGFCNCPWGKAGDRCEKSVDECKKIGLDCTENPNITCSYYDRGILYPKETYCQCPKPFQGYDYVGKVCKDCECGLPDKFDCSFNPDGSKVCFCDAIHYEKDGVCARCNCGDYGLYCKEDNGTKVCQCYDGYQDNGYGYCVECDCADYNAECSFRKAEKVCTCKDGYIRGEDQKCHGGCNVDSDCSNGGLCVNRLCKCLPGTKGDKCEIVEPCYTISDTWRLCGQVVGVKCAFNQTVRQPYCACKDDNYGYDAKEQKCKEKCGSDRNCQNGAKCVKEVCRCLPGTKGDRCEIIEICQTESDVMETCGDSFLSKCVYNQTSHRVFCTCKYPQEYAYDPLTRDCKHCDDCGPNAVCEYDVTHTVCVCKEGYARLNDTCYECDCGLHGKCHYDVMEKVCDCDAGYELKDGICKEIVTSSAAPSGQTSPSISTGTPVSTEIPSRKTSPSFSSGTSATSTSSEAQSGKTSPSISTGTPVSDITSTDGSGEKKADTNNHTGWRTGTIVLGVLLAACLIGGVALVLKLRSPNYEHMS